MAKEKKGVRLEHVSKIYQDPKAKKDFYAVHDANITIEPGEFVTLLGPSGCGKTTILRMIAGFESPDEGEIFLADEPINALTPNKRDTAMVFQSYALLPHYNIFDNVAYGLKLRKMDAATIRSKVEHILALVGLEGMEDRRTNQLSGGQQQRVALARALVIEPGVLLFDEPLSNLDAKLRVDMRTEIRRIQQEAGITAIYVTHDQSEAMALSDKIIVMKKGIINQIGDPHTIYHRPCDEFVADFIGESNFLRGRVVELDDNAAGGPDVAGGENAIDAISGVAEIEGHKIPVAQIAGKVVGDDITLVLRPESAHVADEGVLPCEVVLSRFMGHYQHYHVQCESTLVKITEFNPKNKHIYEVGDQAWLAFDKYDVHAL